MSKDRPAPYPLAERRLRLGMVGGGGGGLVAEWHWSGARLSNRWDLVAAAPSSRPDVAREAGQAWHLAEDRVYADWAEMAKAEAARSDGIEAVAICTPNHTHRPIAEAFMAAGIDIICDKPLANRPEDAEALAAAQLQAGVVFAVTHPYVYHPMVRQARDMIANGAIGRITQVLVEYAQDHGTRADPDGAIKTGWRSDPAKVGRASATADIGTHAFHLIEHVTGQRVARLRADFHRCGAGARVLEDTVFMNLAFEGGAPGTMWVTQAAPGNYCALTFRVYGTDGGLSWNQEEPERLRFTPIGEPEQTIARGHGAGMLPDTERMLVLPRGHPDGLPAAWGNLYTEIAVAVAARRAGRPVPAGMAEFPGLDEGARGIRFIHAAADSHEAGGVWTDIT